MLKVIIDFNAKNDENKSVINFYSDRKSDTGAHNVSSGIITDLATNISQNPDNASGENPKLRFSVGEVWTGSAADYDQPSLPFRRRSLSYGGTSQRGGFSEELIYPSVAQFY